nr:MAG TPA: hypothetical protein [Bacteriophage sp.]
MRVGFVILMTCKIILYYLDSSSLCGRYWLIGVRGVIYIAKTYIVFS